MPSFKFSHEYLFYNFSAVNYPYYSLQPQIWFTDQVVIFYDLIYFGIRSRLQDDYHIKRMSCVLGLKVGKVLIFFIVKLNKNSISLLKVLNSTIIF